MTYTIKADNGYLDMEMEAESPEEIRIYIYKTMRSALSQTVYADVKTVTVYDESGAPVLSFSPHLTIREMRNLLGITQLAFSHRYDIPKRNIENWEAGKNKMPEWALKLLQRVVIEDYEESLRA